jgi:NAD+ synthetase
MNEITDYGRVFDTLVAKTKEYLISNNLKAMILGISGGIDSTVCAAICHEVSKQTGIPLIGRSLPTKFNKDEEASSANLVGKAFCDDFEVCSISDVYEEVENSFSWYESKSPTPLSSGNIQARLRMIYLYNVASLHKGLVIDTDNLTEHNLGYWTVHGDVGDFNPIGGLWKTEVFKLAEYLIIRYNINKENDQCLAVEESFKLKPTAGLGITNNDLEELGAESYEQVDAILQEILAWKSFKDPDIAFKSLEEEKLAFLDEQQMLCYPMEVIIAIAERHFKSEFKRKRLPITISRYLYTR